MTFLLDDYKLSKWAFNKCVDILDYGSEGKLEDYRDLIKHPFWAFRYCTLIEDNPEVRKRINGEFFRFYELEDIANKEIPYRKQMIRLGIDINE